jgi:hypothetical protein
LYGSDESCTNSYQQDRVDVLKKYADYSWSLDPTHYIIEHLGGNTEEQQWANYRIAESPSKGIMMWGKMTDNYNELSMGYPANISGMTSASRGFTANRLMGYAESHDEERLMYKKQYGNTNLRIRETFRWLCQGCQLLELFLYWFQDKK